MFVEATYPELSKQNLNNREILIEEENINEEEEQVINETNNQTNEIKNNTDNDNLNLMNLQKQQKIRIKKHGKQIKS